MRKLLSLVAALLLCSVMAFSQTTRTASGKVADDKGDAIPFATVAIKGTKYATIADANGYFSIKVKTGDVLVISAQGSEKKEVTVGTSDVITVSLTKSNTALQFRYYLLVVILMLIELMPVIAKTLLPSGTYDEKVKLREEMEREVARSNISKEQELNEMYNAMAKSNDEEAITAFFSLTKEDRHEKIKAFSKKWRTENHETFDGLWGKMKREILSKQEN